MRKSFRKKLYGLPVIAGMAIAMLGMNMGVVSAEESGTEPEEYVGGFIPVEKEFYEVQQSDTTVPTLKAAKKLKKKYRSDTQPWAEGIKVKDQKQSGLCWAFSTTTASEYSYAKEMYETTGKVATAEELSPGHLAQFYFFHVVDPLGNTEGDMNLVDPTEHWATLGGNGLFGMQHLAGWSGLASEETAPIQKVFDHIVDYEWDGSINPYSADIAYKDALVLQESIAYMRGTKDIIKNLVMQHGAVSIAIAYSKNYTNPDEIDPETGEPYVAGRSYYNYKNDTGLNHAVTVIGWDDTYPKENFAHEVTDSKTGDTKTVMPTKNGALIVQNSWGIDANEKGCFYISYESAELHGKNYTIAFDMQPTDTYKYNFHYDGTAGLADSSDRNKAGGYRDYYTTPGTRAANVFTNTTGHPIEVGAVGYTTFNNGQTYYDVSVYTGLTDPADPESGTCAGTTRISSTTVGCKTAELDFKTVVAPGESYSVVFRFPDFTAFGTELTKIEDSRGFQARIDEGQSFFCPATSGKWKDMADYDACFRIKAFANDYEDKTAPKIAGDSLETDLESGSDVYFGSEVGVSVQVTDELAMDSVSVEYEAEGADEVRILDLSASEEDPNLWVGTFEVTDATSTGAWYVKQITAKDKAGNEAVLYNSKVSTKTPKADLSAADFTVIGEVPVGWQKQEDGTWVYYSEDGTKVTGWLEYEKKWYYMDETTGVMKTGWVKYKNSWYYLMPSGAMATGWKKVGNDWYYLKPSGIMAANEWIRGYWLNRNGTWTYEPKGSWKRDKNGWWYGDTSGWYAKKQWMKIDSHWYYFNASGYIVTGTQEIDGKTYTFSNDGEFIK